jgi:hypothetical protein
MKKIIVYSSAKFHGLVNAKLSLKAKRQPRRKDGRFAKPLPKPATVENNLMVQFFYPMSNEPLTSKLRQVRLISSTATHFTGMERVGDKWKFKKYLAPKARGFRIVSFNPQSMS